MPQYYQLATNKVKIWWDSARWVALPNSAVPCLLGGLLAFVHDKFNLLYFIIAFLGIIVVHLGTNLLDDYADLKIGGSSLRDRVQDANSDPIRTVKARYVLNGDIKLNHLLYASLGLFALGIAACIFLTIKSGWPVAAIAAIGALICFFYSMPPISLSYHGLGELVVSAAMGPGICLGTYYAVSGSFSWEAVLISIPVGVLVGLILFVHSIMDYKPDAAVNKKTLVAILGNRRRAVNLVPVLLTLAFGIVVYGVILRILPLYTLLVFLSLPMAIGLVQSTFKLKDGRYDQIQARWWMGPMEQMLEGHDWFLIPWRQARNLLIAFTLLVFLAYAIELIF